MLPKLGIDLQEGFASDVAIVMINGKELFREEHLTTRLVIGLAKSFTVQVEEGMVDVKVLVPTKEIDGSVKLKVESDRYIGISIVDGKISFNVLREPFYYM